MYFEWADYNATNYYVERKYYIKKPRDGRDIVGLHFFTSLIRSFENSKEHFLAVVVVRKKQNKSRLLKELEGM